MLDIDLKGAIAFDDYRCDDEEQQESGPLTQRFEMIIDNMRDEEQQALMSNSSKSSNDGKSARKLSPYEAHQKIKRKKKEAIQRKATSDFLSSTKTTSNLNLRCHTLESDQSPASGYGIPAVPEEPEHLFTFEQMDFLTPPGTGKSRKSKYLSPNGRAYESSYMTSAAGSAKVPKTKRKKRKKSTSVSRRDSQL